MDEEDIKSITNSNQHSNELIPQKLSDADDVHSSYECHDTPKKEENIKSNQTDSKITSNLATLVSDHESNGSETKNFDNDKDTERPELWSERTKNETTVLPSAELASASCSTTGNVIPITRESLTIGESADSNSTNEILIKKDSGVEIADKNRSIVNKHNADLQLESDFNSNMATSGRNTVEIVPENISVEPTCAIEAKCDLQLHTLSDTSNNNEEKISANCNDQFGNNILKDANNCINQTGSPADSANIEVGNLNPSESIAEINVAQQIKPNSLAEDARLVKFSVSAKSVNLMQSNAQFLNKSRNFLNFITEKSTNIMEKTLLPQNLAAKYNSILKLTENNATNYNKFIENNTASSHSTDSELNSEASNQISFHGRHLNKNDIESTNLSAEGHGNKSGTIHDEDKGDSAEEHQSLFLKCSVNEKELNNSLIKNKKTTVPASDINSKCNQSDSNSSTENMLQVNEINCSDFVADDVNKNFEILPRANETIDIKTECEKFQSENLDEESKNKEQDSIEIPRDASTDLELLAHPAYMALLRDYSNLKDESVKLSEAMAKVEMENQRLDLENNKELHALQLEGLEKTIERLKHDLKQANANQELLNKEYTLANKEKESMVMKYAISEKQLIDTQRAREYAERKVNEALREQELLHTKLKQVHGERTRICNILDGKCHELTDAQKEVERLKEELNLREVKLKWTQNKLKTELETYKENQQKLDKAMLRINELKEECEQVKKESHETIRKFQQSEENKVVTLDHQLKEQQARLILERHVTEDKEMSRLQLQKEVETLKQRQHVLIEENNALSLKVQNLEKEKLNYENNLSNLKVIADQRQEEILDLVGKVSQLETLKLQLKHKEQLLSSNEAEVEQLRQSNAELQSDMEWCREREAHMLDFTEKLTDKNVRLQSEFTSIEAKNEQLELEQGPLRDEIKELTSKVKSLEISLASEKSKRIEECELLARHVAEQTQLARNLSQKLEDSQGENVVLRRKQQISVKEMTKELQQCKKRLDAFETRSPNNSLDRTSRTGSSSSLSTGETLNGGVSDNSNSGDNILQTMEPDRQTLIDRIVKLQRTRVRQAEKLDFLEEHTKTLVNELQKKTKIIKNYILHENPDAMGSNERDRNKAELARHGGIMASVYNHRVSDDNMTLELSLEINQKLQAVLEDTLLKNITLKDSIDTLGGEIARLTMQNKRKQ